MTPMNQLSANQVPYKKPVRKVGFYGCVGKVVRLEGEGVSFPRVMRLDCPGCGHNHVARPFWRKVIPDLDDGKVGMEVHLASV